MKLKPILFSTPMVQAILENRKTQTRRIVKFKTAGANHTANYERAMISDSGDVFRFFQEEDWLGWFDEKPKYNTGDILWVRETWQYTDASLNDHPGYVYRASDPDWETLEGWKWKPSIHMPKEAARLFLKVTNVRCERLQDITVEDIIKEGLTSTLTEHDACMDLKEQWIELWQSINGKDSWEQNPFVWVYEFERIEKPIPCDN